MKQQLAIGPATEQSVLSPPKPAPGGLTFTVASSGDEIAQSSAFTSPLCKTVCSTVWLQSSENHKGLVQAIPAAVSC